MKKDRSIRTDMGEEHGVSRRGFLRTVGGAAVAAVGASMIGMPTLAEAAGAGVPDSVAAERLAAEATAIRAHRMNALRRRRSMLDKLTREVFAGHLNTKFRAKSGSSGVVDLILISATDRNTRKVPGVDTFSIIFRGAHARPLEQGTYRFTHRSIGAFDLFIVPVGKDDKGLLYEAVFNRFTS